MNDIIFIDEVIGNALILVAKNGGAYVSHSQILTYIEALEKLASKLKMGVEFIKDDRLQVVAELSLEPDAKVINEENEKLYYACNSQSIDHLRQRYYENLALKRKQLYEDIFASTCLMRNDRVSDIQFTKSKVKQLVNVPVVR